MPNEIKNALKALTSHVTANHTMSRQLPVAGSSTVSVMVWTISGIVLASCGGGGGGGAGGSGLSVSGSGSNGDGGGGGPTSSGPTGRIARVVDGPVKDAAVYFDIDGDGEVSDSERAEQTQNNRPMYITDANGYVNAPIAFEGHFFIADVDGAIDTATGEELSGEYQSLSTGGIATPITDLITDRIGPRGSDADAQGVLDDISGTDGLVTVADIRDAEKYKIQEYDVPKPTLPSDPTNAEEQAQYDRDITKYKTSVIMKSSLALSEIDKDEAFTNLESSIARVDALKQIFDDDPNNGDSALMARIDARVDAGREILGISKPLAQPDSSISPINEDSVFRFPQNSEDIFGFDDPNGNSDDAAASRFTGIYVKSSVDFPQADDDAHTVNLLYDGSPLSRHEGAGSDSLPDNLPPEVGFYYVSSENLSRLSISPSDDDSGTLEVEYYVFDGEQWSDKASLEITVSPVDDPATGVAAGAQDLTAIDENTVTTGMKVADLRVDDADGPPHRLEVRGDNTGFFEIRNEDELWLVVDTGEILDYETTPTLTVQVGVSGAPDITPVNITVAVNNLNDNAPVISLEGGQNQVQNPLTEGIFPNTPTDTGYRYTASDADGGTSTLRVSGDVQDRFAIDASDNLQIKAGAEFDYETPADRAITLTITATDSGVGSGNPPAAATQEVIITFGDANESPKATPKLGISTAENTPYVFKSDDFGFSDEDAGDDQFDSVIITSLPGAGQGTLALNGASVRVGDAITLTGINAGQLVYTPTEVSQGQPYNAQIGYRVLDDGDGNGAHKLSSATETLVIAVRGNQSATGVAVGTRFLTAIDENTVTTGMKVADLRVDDADGPPHRLEVRGDNTGFFEIRDDDELWLVLQEGQTLDYETTPTLTVQVGIAGVPDITPVNISVAVNNVNDNAPEISLEGGQNQVQNPLDEGIFPNTPTDTGYSYTANDADGGTSTLSVSGDPQNRFAIDASGNLQIKAGSEFNYETPADRAITLTITATDSGVGSGSSPVAATQEVIITFGDANDAPTATPKLGISTNDNAPYTFSAVDFGFRDEDVGDLDDQFDSVIITSLLAQGQGTLELNGNPVVVNTPITLTDITNGLLVYTPTEMSQGQPYNAQIGYRVLDDGDGNGAHKLSSATETLVIAVRGNQSATGVAVGTRFLTAIDENTVTAGMKVADLDVTDTDGPPHRLEVRGDNTGFFEIRDDDELWLVVNTGETLDYETTPALAVQVGVSGDSTITPVNITVRVNNVNDNAPVISLEGGQNQVQNPLDEGLYSIDTDTGYRYTANDADGGTSTLSLSGDPQNRFAIDASGNLQIKAGSEFNYETPADRAITLTITATDSGVGSGSSPVAATQEVIITFGDANDAPTATPKLGISTAENTPYVFKSDDFGFGDVDAGDDQFDSVIITSLPAQGTLMLNGARVSSDITITLTGINAGQLVYAPTEMSQGQPYNAQIGYRVLDDGDGNGAHKLSSATETLVIAVRGNQSATGVAVGTRFLTAIDENTVTTGMKVADLRVDDADGPPHRLEVRGDNTGFFEIRNEDELWLVVNTGETLDYETTRTLAVQVGVSGDSTITPVNITVRVNDVNERPIVIPRIDISTTHDRPYILQAVDFGFRDEDANDSQFDTVVITSVPGAEQGTLVYSGNSVRVGNGFTFSQINAGRLVYTPAEVPQEQTIYNAEIGYRVTDNGDGVGTNSLSSKSVTLVIEVGQNQSATAVSVIAQGRVTAIDENTDLTGGMKVADLNVTDTDGAPHRLVVSGANAGLFAIRNDDELWLVEGATLDFETTPTLTVQVEVSGAPAINTGAINVRVNNVNEAPAATPRTDISTADNTPYVFKADDFGFSDVDADDSQFHSVIITSLQGQGTLELNGVSVSVGDEITFTDINNGRLVYTPNEVSQGQYNAAIGYRVQDDGDGADGNGLRSDVATLVIGVVAANQSATAVAVIVQGRVTDIDENMDLTGGMKVADLDVTDTDGAPHRLVLGGDNAGFFAIRNEDELWLVEGATLDFENTPTLTVQVEVFGAPAINTGAITVRLNNVNEAPTATPRTDISTATHPPYVFKSDDFGFSDVDADDSQFHSVIITSLPVQGQGTLELNGVSVSVGDEITFTDINNGRLVYTSNEVSQGQYNAAIGYRVQDDGDGAGGNGLRSDVATLVIGVVAANQSATAVAVIAQGRVTAIDENTDLTGGMKVADLNVTDTDGAPHRLVLGGDNAGFFAIRNEDEIWLVEGATLDFETTPTLTVQVEVFGAPAINTGAITVRLNNVNEAPTATPRTDIWTPDNTPYVFKSDDFGFSDVDADDLDNQFDSVIITSLPGQGTLTLDDATVSADDAISLDDITDGLLIYTPTAPQPEQPIYNAEIGYRVVDDGDAADGANKLSSDAATLVIAVGGNQPATSIARETQFLTAIDENTDLTAGMKVADLDVTDADGPPHRLEVRGDNTGFFVIRNEDELWLVLQEGQTLDYESTPTLTVQVEVSGAPAINTGAIIVAVNNLNDNTPAIERTGTQNILHEKTYYGNTGRPLNTGYSYEASDADGGTSTLRVSGDPQNRFEIDADGNLRIIVGSTFDYEVPADRSITLTITATDSGVGSGNQPINATETVTIEFDNLLDEPVVITPSGAPVPLDEGLYSIDTDTGYRYVASDADDPDQTISLTVTGDPLNRFQLDRDGNLQIKAGSSFDYETPEDRAINLGITYFQSNAEKHNPEPVTITLPVTITFRDVSTEINIDSGDADFSIAINGSLVTGAVLTATEITPDPDIDDAVYSYQWYHIGAGTSGTDVDIEGAMDRSYTIADADEGKRIGVRVSYEEDSFQSDGTTPTGTETITAELPIVDFTEIRDISSEIVYSSEYITRRLLAGISTEETGDRLILGEFGGNDRSVFDITNPHRVTDSRYVYGISGVDKDHFMFVQDGSRISIVSKTGFNYENPTDSDQDNNYEFTLASSILGVGPISYTLTIVDNISEARVKTATASIIETSSSIKFTSLEDAVRAYSGIDDALLGHSATFGGAVVDGANPHRAMVTFEVAGQADIVFTYELSGDDVSDVLLVQDGNDVSLITVAGLDYENPADEDEMSTYSVVETITTTSPNLPSAHRAVSTTYTLSVTDKPSEVSIEVYENHPLYKSLEIDTVDLQGYQLTQGYVDNALFTIDRNGEVRWKAIPDHEAPHDGDGNNLYEIELSRTNFIGQMDRVQVDIMVKDTGINSPPEEDYSPILLLHPDQIADEHLPSDFVQHLIFGYNTWRVPATGPVIIQHSVDMDNIASFYNNNQLDISRFHSLLDVALLSFERVANLKFVEVAHGERDDNVPYIYVEIDPNIFGSGASRSIDEPQVLIRGGRYHFTSNKLYVASEGGSSQRTITHELGHALGLHHPFDESLGWPGDEAYQYSLLSVMAYNDDVLTLQPADIEALQFLYGAPGTNFMGVESIMAESAFANKLASRAQTVTSIDENTDLTDGIKVTDIVVTDRDRGAFGTLEIVGDHAEFFEIRSSDPNADISSLRNGELWLVLEGGETLEDIATLEVYLRIAEKHAVRTEDITITVNDADISGAAGSSRLVGGATGDSGQIKINEAVDEGQSVIANLIDLDLGEIDLTEITIGGDDKDQVQIRQTQNGGVLEFVSAPDFEAPKDDDEDSVYEITLYDDLTSIEVDIMVIDIPEI